MKMYKELYVGMLYIIFILIFTPLQSKGDDKRIVLDSLWQVTSLQKEIPEKADNLVKLANRYMDVDLDSALIICKQALSLSNKINYPEGKADAHYYMSLIFNRKGDYVSAREDALKAMRTSESIQDDGRIGKTYYHYANVIRKQDKLDSAQYYYKKSLQIFQISENQQRMFMVYNALGNNFERMAVFDSAAIYFVKAARLCEELGNKRSLGTIYSNLGDVYYQLQQYEDAKRYYELSLEIDKEYNRIRSMAITYTRLGNLAHELNELDSALHYYKLSELYYTQTGNKNGMANLYLNYGAIFNEQEKYYQAIENYDKAMEYYLEQNHTEGMITVLMNKGSAYSKLHRYRESLRLNDSCLSMTRQLNDKKNQLDALENIHSNYYRLGDYKKSADYRLEYILLKDSVYNLDQAELIAEYTMKYEKEKDQARILALENENLAKDLDIMASEKKKNIYFFSGLGIIIIILFLFIFFRYKTQKEKVIAEQKIRQLEEERKVLAAKALVEGQEEERKRIAEELHDGLGVLLSATKMQFTNIKDKSPENRSLIEKATELLEQATGDVRKISHNMMPGLLTKYGVIEAIEDLFENLDETDGLSAVAQVEAPEERLPENKEIMLYRIVQELVNNTLKHAQAKNIVINIQAHPDQLQVIYTDDGKGFVVEEKMDSKSIGLQSIQSRVNFLNGKLKIESKPGDGVKFIIHIPL